MDQLGDQLPGLSASHTDGHSRVTPPAPDPGPLVAVWPTTGRETGADTVFSAIWRPGDQAPRKLITLRANRPNC